MKTSFRKWLFFLRSVRYYQKSLFWVSIGVALTAMIITGALLIGDSVQGTLRHLAENRLGKVKTAIYSQERWFRSIVSENLKKKFGGKFSSIISMKAYASAPQNDRGIAVSFYGIGSDFFSFAPPNATLPVDIQPGEVFLNQTAARSLNVKVGDAIILRTSKPSRMPGDAPLSKSDLSVLSTQLRVSRILDSQSFGDFNPQTTQHLSPNIFVNRDYLAEKLGRKDRANVLLSGNSGPLLTQLKQTLQITDYGLHFHSQGKIWELLSDRVFISPTVDTAAKEMDVPQQRIFGYFVNSIQCDQKSVPYSFIAGLEEPPVAADLKNEEILINQWLAEQLHCPLGSTVQLKGYRLRHFGALYEQTFDFTLRDVIPMSDPAVDSSLMPHFPGLENVDSCRDWDPNLPIDLTRIRPEDEDYWAQYREAPKAFITLSAAQRSWSNRFGELTAIRFHTDLNQQQLSSSLIKHLHPENLGFQFLDLNMENLQGINNAVDFSGLFFALSFFIIVAALLLTVLLFTFYLEQRYREYSVLQTIGFDQKTIWKLYTCEGLLCSFFGCILGVIGGIGYAWIMLHGLNTLWRGAVNGAHIELFIPGSTLLAGGLVSIFAVLIAIALSVARFLKSTTGEKLRGEVKLKRIHSKRTGMSAVFFFIFSLLVILIAQQGENITNVGLFFFVGSMLLIATTQGSACLLAHFPKFCTGLSSFTLAWRNCVRRSDRSMAVIRLLALGIFLTLAVTANRQGIIKNPLEKTSGTGGFSYYLETAVPVMSDMNSAAGRDSLKLDEISPRVSFVQMPTIPGSEASCLNLNHVVRPHISGVDPISLQGRFSFKKIFLGIGKGWEILDYQFIGQDIIPVVADMNVIQWSLGKKLGDFLEYENSSGKKYRLRFVGGLNNSLFQGRVLVSLENFYRLYPEASGSTIALINAPASLEKNTVNKLIRALSRYGLNLESSAERLNRFNTVQNTYLAVFFALGGIGLVLGCGGLVILIRRNLMERHSEMTFLRTIGYSKKEIQSMVFYEHFVLFIFAIFCGMISAAVALIPIFQTAPEKVSWGEIGLFVGLILVSGVLSILSANRFDKKIDLSVLRQLAT